MMTPKNINFLQFISGEENIIRKKAGEEITQIGKPGDVMYVLKSGQARIDLLGGRYTVDLEPGMLIGLMGLFDGRDYEDTCVATTDCELIPINRRRAEFMVQEHPTFPFRVMRVMIDRFYFAMDLLKETGKAED
jgi:CRP/FNR family transcriptional regulator, cyclic AMP receptor protein